MASSGIRGISEFDRTRSGCTNEMMYLRQVMDHKKLFKLQQNTKYRCQFSYSLTMFLLFIFGQADHLTRVGRYSNALLSLNIALDLNQSREPYTEKEELMMIVSLIVNAIYTNLNCLFLQGKILCCLNNLLYFFHQKIATKLAPCHLRLGNLAAANALAEKVLEIDTNNVDAIYSKAESLYYNCEFERALLTYHRGSVSIRIFTKIR